jgi:soluble lytic murein transglycosylase-like protein/TolA-binding protein
MPTPDRRQLELAQAKCAQLLGQTRLARSLLMKLLEESHDDLPAREAAERVAALPTPGDAKKVYGLLGVTFHRHREFERSAHFLQQVVISFSAELRERESFETLYQLSRSHFWQGHYRLAAERFGELAEQAQESEERAQALYQQARSYELLGDWQAAARNFRRAYLANPNGNWAGPALLSALRLEWRTGREQAADELLPVLKSRYQWRGELARAALFLAASEIVRGRSERVGTWLMDAERTGRAPAVEVAYWRGRFYLRALKREPYHPLALAARRRLAAEALSESARSEGLRLASSRRSDNLHSAWLLLGDGLPEGIAARQGLEQQLRADRSALPFLTLDMVPADRWTLWERRLERPEEMLLALSVWSEGGTAVLRHFPVSQPELAFTASHLLAQAGEIKRSLYIAEILGKRVPRRLPPQLLPEAYRQLVFPLPYEDLLRREGQRQIIDPFLLAALIREESRFDPGAVSAASARGLTQFVFATARRLALKLGLGRISPRDLDRPEITIALGAAYLAELRQRFHGRIYPVIAAYNAGEAQAQVWLSLCYSRSSDEYFSKVGFPETRAYLAKVVASRAQYRELYGQ